MAKGTGKKGIVGTPYQKPIVRKPSR